MICNGDKIALKGIFHQVQIMKTALGRANGRCRWAVFPLFLHIHFDFFLPFFCLRGGWSLPTISSGILAIWPSVRWVQQEALVEQVMGREVKNFFPLLTHSFLLDHDFDGGYNPQRPQFLSDIPSYTCGRFWKFYWFEWQLC